MLGLAVPPDPQLTLTELAQRSNTAARTIRFYIARGLLDGPVRAGRGAYYTNAHLKRIEEIRGLQAKGLMLAEIAVRHRAPEARLAAPEAWSKYTVSPDVQVMVRGGASPWRQRLIRAALAELMERLQQGDTNGVDGN